MASKVTKDEKQLLIGGRWVDAGDGTYDIVNPATEEVVGQARPRPPPARPSQPGPPRPSRIASRC